MLEEISTRLICTAAVELVSNHDGTQLRDNEHDSSKVTSIIKLES